VLAGLVAELAGLVINALNEKGKRE
jgi:hypothetical protein